MLGRGDERSFIFLGNSCVFWRCLFGNEQMIVHSFAAAVDPHCTKQLFPQVLLMWLSWWEIVLWIWWFPYGLHYSYYNQKTTKIELITTASDLRQKRHIHFCSIPSNLVRTDIINVRWTKIEIQSQFKSHFCLSLHSTPDCRNKILALRRFQDYNVMNT